MSDLPADVWVPVPLRWRHVAPGDTFEGQDKKLWHVEYIGIGSQSGLLGAVVRRANDQWNGKVDPDEVVNVLVPVTERDAVELCRDELGARLADRRSVEQRSTSQQTI